jgi:lipopolysaccharide export system protein LptC
LLNGTLTADKLRITEKGALVRFEGHVVMNLIMDNPDPASAEPEPVPEAPAAQPTKARPSSAKRANAK